MSPLSIGLAALLALLAAQNAYSSTHGSFIDPHAGYSIAADVHVGAYSDHEHEAEVYRQQLKEAGKVVRTHRAVFSETFAAGVNPKGRFTRFLKHLDRKRSKPMQEDYRARFTLQWPQEIERFSIYLHPKPKLARAVESKLIASFVLNQLGAGGYYSKFAKAKPGERFRDRLSWLLEGWQYTDMGAQLSHVLDAAYKSPEQISEEAARTPATPESLLARMIQAAMKGESMPGDLVIAVLQAGRENLTVLLLLFTPDSDWARVAAAVRKHPSFESLRDFLTPLLTNT